MSEMAKTKLIFHSNAPHAPTGYGQQCSLFVPKLAEHYDVRISSYYGVEAATVEWQGIRVMPGVGNTFGMESLAAHVEKWFDDPRDGIVFTLMDTWVLDPDLCKRWNVVCWTPVDHEPPPPRVMGFLRASQAVPVAMTRNGQEQLQEFDPLYCPHGVDTSVMRPLGRELARQKIGIPQDAFLVGVVAANKGNPSRKSLVEILQAFAEVRRKNEKAILYLHTDISGEFARGVPLIPVMEALRLPDDSVRFADQYRIYYDPVSPQLMALLYSAMDVLAHPSTGEGFGIPALEAQACGVPVITTDFTAMRELGRVGWKVRSIRQWSLQQSWQAVPDVKSIVTALERCARMSPEQRLRMSKQAREFALDYDVDRVFTEHMLPSLEAAEERLRRRRPRLVAARANA